MVSGSVAPSRADLQLHVRPRLAAHLLHDLLQRQPGNRLAVHLQEHVAGLQVGLARRRVRHGLHDGGDALVHRDAGADAFHLALQAALHALHVVGREVGGVPLVAERFQHPGDGEVRHLDGLHTFLIDIVFLDEVPRLPEGGEVFARRRPVRRPTWPRASRIGRAARRTGRPAPGTGPAEASACRAPEVGPAAPGKRGVPHWLPRHALWSAVRRGRGGVRAGGKGVGRGVHDAIPRNEGTSAGLPFPPSRQCYLRGGRVAMPRRCHGRWKSGRRHQCTRRGW